MNASPLFDVIMTDAVYRRTQHAATEFTHRLCTALKNFQIPSSNTSICSSYTVPAVNQAPRHGDLLKSGGTVPRILNLPTQRTCGFHLPDALGLEKGS